jgi:hypothetical protein
MIEYFTAPFISADYDEGHIESYRGIVVKMPKGAEVRFHTGNPFEDVLHAQIYAQETGYGYILFSSSLDNLATDLRKEMQDAATERNRS